MNWHLGFLYKGNGYKESIAYWPSENIIAAIPVAEELLCPPTDVAEKTVLILMQIAETREKFPLVWADESGSFQCALPINEWIHCMKREAYRKEHSKPLWASLPFKYQMLPGWLKFNIIKTITQIKYFYITPRKNSFPLSNFNGGCSILQNILNIDAEKNEMFPVVSLTHDIETKEGFDLIGKISSIEKKYGFRSAWYFIPKKYDIRKDILTKLLHDGNEIGLHGISHDNNEAFYEKTVLSEKLNELRPLFAEFEIKGYRSPSWYRTANMFSTLAEFFLYDSSCLDNDLVCPGGDGGVGFMRPINLEQGIVELPCTLPFELPLYYGFSPEKILEFWEHKIDFIFHSGGMLLVNTHADLYYLGREGVMNAYEKLLKMIANRGWKTALPKEIAAQYTTK